MSSAEPYHDEYDLVQKALNHDKDAWDALFFGILEPYINGMAAKAFLPGQPDLFEEAVLDAVYQVYANLKRYRGEAKITTWCYYYVMNAISKNWRVMKDRRRTETIDLAGGPTETRWESHDPEEDMERRLLLLKVEEALSDMNVVYRRAIEMSIIQGLTAQEIARREAVSVNTVKSWLKRARKKLREHFEESQ